MGEDEEAEEGAGATYDVRARLGSDFALRLASGVAMGAVAGACILAGPLSFAVLVVVVTLVLSWEWGRLVHGREADLVIAVHVGAAGVAAVLAAAGFVGLGLLTLAIGAILALLLSLGANSLFSGFGVFYAGLPAVALIWLRSDADLGLSAVMFLILIVVVSDTAGFLAGRLLGGPKLWPRVSPNKTWAGVIGALAASSIAGALFSLAVAHGSAMRLATAGALLSLVAQAGDLLESAIKRRFGAKDASSLIPGHGGVMDRVDGIVATATAVGLASFVIDVHSPARALLLGS
ncbi:MAG TPA: phosphatidate cytidylyltransferase [Hyphomicrobiaceae bacterium]|nr:phosphatidate cytidylyltransferase [Hyphomicrobiaceae bacterium]